MPSDKQVPLDIAVGILVDQAGRLLIALRRPGTPGEGLWEFPGGKREGEEPMRDCLARELAEEVGVTDCRLDTPLIRFMHTQGERPVRLHVWRIDQWQGEPSGLEGQQLAWVERGALVDYPLLPATDVILCALDLPDRYPITPALSAADPDAWWARLDSLLAQPDIRLLRLRDQGLSDADYQALAAKVVEAAGRHDVAVLVDRSLAVCEAVGAAGLHWSVARLLESGRPELAPGQLLAVSAHTGTDLATAVERGADFAVLSPVAATPTHPGAPALGWEGWCAARADHALPVYALGGLGEADLTAAQRRNAQGVAAIRGFWKAAVD